MAKLHIWLDNSSYHTQPYSINIQHLFQGVELEQVDSSVTPTDANVAIEREPRHLPLGISMRNLKKVSLFYFKL
jgi:hypothetical protein